MIPARRYHEVIGVLAGVLGELAVDLGGTVGWVGLVAGEPPLLVALAPHRDAVARRMASVLTEGDSHRVPSLWLFLQPGIYLGQVVDPNAATAVDEQTLATLVQGGLTRLALLVEVATEPSQCRVALTLVSDPPRLRACLRLARHELTSLGGWERAM